MFWPDRVHSSPTVPGAASVPSCVTIRICTHEYGLPHERSSSGV
jgi:hypothetical protein